MRAVKVFSDPKAFELAADPTRRRMIHLLRAKELSVSQIAGELGMTPQAIYHHVRKMVEAGLIEVAREERVDHFIETYYQAAAEVFSFTYGEPPEGGMEELQVRGALATLAKLGLIQEFDEGKVKEILSLYGEMGSNEKCCTPEMSDAISKMDDLDFFTKQTAMDLANTVAMGEKQFEALCAAKKRLRVLLRPKPKKS